ncbi:MAG: hypothetical protein AB7G28_03285 [Pirellulales bacterium]
MGRLTFLVVFTSNALLLPTACFSAVSKIDSPSQIESGTTISFDGIPDLTVLNTLYQNQGVTFTRDDAGPIFAFDVVAIGRITTSPRNVLATIQAGSASGPTTHLNVLTTAPAQAIGAYFGNDQNNPDFKSIRLSAYGLAGELLGSVESAANNNIHVDQFIGLRSDSPIGRVRFQNLNATGGLAGGYSVVIDDLVFSSAAPNVPGDFNADQFVDAADYTTWRDHLGTSFNLNGNGSEEGASAGVVDLADYALWTQHFAQPGSASHGSIVPEPIAVLTMSTACCFVCSVRRRQINHMR